MSDKDPVNTSSGTALQDQFKEESEFEPLPPKPDREGLPPGYRMRADAHYVEHLTSRRGDRTHAELVRPNADSDRDARDRTERLLAQLGEDLSTIESSVSALAGEPSRLARRINVDLLKSQVWRASWSLRAHALLGGTARTQIRPRPLAFLLGQVRSGWAAECRLLGLTLHVQSSDWNAVVSVDEQTVITGITGGVIATLGVLGQAEGATIGLAATAANGELRSVEIVQEEVTVGSQLSARFFDQGWTDRPGGWFAGLGAAAARAAAQYHGGETSFESTSSGTAISLGFSR